MTVSAELATTTSAFEKVPTVHRQLSDTEASYFLPARANGVNDMCVPIPPPFVVHD